jgi:hypothetical protein
VSLTLWILLVTVAMIGAALAAMTTLPARRAAGLLAAAAAVTGLLVLLGLDLPAVVWRGVGGAAALLAAPAGGEAAPGPSLPGDRPSRGSLLTAGVGAGLLVAIIYRVALQVDWRPQPPGAVAGEAAVAGGRLLSADAALLAVTALLLTAALMLGGRRREPGGGS